MSAILKYITTNENKVRVANKYLVPLGIEVVGEGLDLLETQSESIEEITRYKAKQALQVIKAPLIVHDAGWYIPALNGFPGPFMKFMNHWLTTQDFLNLMQDKNDRTIIYREVLCYIDIEKAKCFTHEIIGHILEEPKGKGEPSRSLISNRPDNKSIAECWEEGIDPVEAYPIWTEFAEWYKKEFGKMHAQPLKE